MHYPVLGRVSASRQMTDAFYGLDRRLRIADGAFSDMENLTSDDYPVLSPRRRRQLLKNTQALGLTGCNARVQEDGKFVIKEALCYIDFQTNHVVFGDKQIPMELTVGHKQLVGMGSYVVIFPDKKYINTLDPEDRGDLEATWSATSTVTFAMCKRDGTVYKDYTYSDVSPDAPENGALWLDTANEPHVLKQYSESQKEWVSITTTYVKITAEGIGKRFCQYDGVTISGIGGPISETAGAHRLNGSAVIWEKGDDYVLVTGLLDVQMTQGMEDGIITLKRSVPDMDFVVEAGNRLWGCKYGTVDDKPVNEIYCSKLGDFKNWQCYMGISTDSWTGSVGSDGPFTGAVNYLGNPLFFKESGLHKVHISANGAHQITDTPCRGVQRDCGKSLAIVGDTLFYKARCGVMAYDGALPVEVGQALGAQPYALHRGTLAQMGNGQYICAVGGGMGNKYYLSTNDAQGQWHLLVYDTAKGLWHREDSFRAIHMCAVADTLYAVDGAGDVWQLTGSREPTEEMLSWYAVTGDLGISGPERKYVSRLTLRLALTPLSTVAVDVQYDNDGIWQQLQSFQGATMRAFPVVLRPRRCDHLRLRIRGKGEAKLYSITRTVEEGSDVG